MMAMKVSPYLNFNGNCAEAVALYEKAFGVKASIMRFTDAPPSEGYTPPPGTENMIMHGCIKLGEDKIMFSDAPNPDVTWNFSNGGLAIAVELEGVDKVKAVYAALLEGGVSIMEPQKTFWAECFSMLTDKFGVTWMIATPQ